MRVVVNGRHQELDQGVTVSALVNSMSVPGGGRGVAVALDGEVVPRSSWELTELSDGARVEIVVPVQGG